MRLAIADPPYPPHVTLRYDLADGSGRVVKRSRATRWYGNGSRSTSQPAAADFHPDAGDWDSRERHQELLTHLVQNYEGWAIATSLDGIEAYTPLPIGCNVMVWVRPNAQPGGHRLRQTCEAVIVFIPPGRRSRADGMVPTHLIAAPPAQKFAGAKPDAWTLWVLDALAFDPAVDTVDDLFPGSGAITRCVESMLVGGS